MKVVINAGHSGFGWKSSDNLTQLLREATGNPKAEVKDYEYKRTDPLFVKTVLAAGAGAGDLKVVRVPDDIDWVIEDYDGKEWVAEKHRTWGKRYEDTHCGLTCRDRWHLVSHF